MQITRVKENGCTIFLTNQELEDLKSMSSLAVFAAKKLHRDSPNFLKAVNKINKCLVNPPINQKKDLP